MLQDELDQILEKWQHSLQSFLTVLGGHDLKSSLFSHQKLHLSFGNTLIYSAQFQSFHWQFHWILLILSIQSGKLTSLHQLQSHRRWGRWLSWSPLKKANLRELKVQPKKVSHILRYYYIQEMINLLANCVLYLKIQFLDWQYFLKFQNMPFLHLTKYKIHLMYCMTLLRRFTIF